MKEDQIKYDDFVRETDIETQDRSSGGKPQEVEIEIIKKYKPKTLLDIGCGSGHRMFPFYQKLWH